MTAPIHRQRGVAVLTAILVVTVATILAVNLMWEARLDQRRTTAALAADQGLMYVLGAEAWVGDILRQDLVDSPDSDHYAEIWAIELPPMPIDGGTIAGSLEDLQGRFNLNNLVLPDGSEDALARGQFERLLLSLDLDPALAGAVIDWLDANGERSFPNGAEDADYADRDPQYRTANVMITSGSELMAVNGFDAQAYAVLAPFVTALPHGTRLNVNTASEWLIASLSDDIDLGLAGSLIEERGEAGFSEIEASFAGLIEADMFAKIDGVSEHFLLTSDIRLDAFQMTTLSVLQRDNSGLTRTLFRSLGVE